MIPLISLTNDVGIPLPTSLCREYQRCWLEKANAVVQGRAKVLVREEQRCW